MKTKLKVERLVDHTVYVCTFMLTYMVHSPRFMTIFLINTEQTDTI